ncbi:MAG TPA: hypothetical protein PKH46_06020 [Candidatus Cryosericum sp.]|nr:hypothetical protein [Candidatus Cryosericum sp.]
MLILQLLQTTALGIIAAAAVVLVLRLPREPQESKGLPHGSPTPIEYETTDTLQPARLGSSLLDDTGDSPITDDAGEAYAAALLGAALRS